MSFFGFDATLPRDRGHPVRAPGFAQAPDPFAGLSRAPEVREDDDDAIDFDDTYDGLGDQLDEANDDLNEDTFGGEDNGSSTEKPIGKDFDFFGQTAKVCNAINEEQLRYSRQQAPPKSVAAIAASPPKTTAKPARTGYEKYKEPGYIPELQANASLWGVAPKQMLGDVQGDLQRQPSYGASVVGNQSGAGAGQTRKMMSLEEVEAAMRSQSKRSSSNQVPQQPMQAQLPSITQIQQRPQQSVPQSQHPTEPRKHMQAQQTFQQRLPQAPRQAQPQHVELPGSALQTPQILQRQHVHPDQPATQRVSPQARQILQNPDRQQPQIGSRPVETFQMPPQLPPPLPGGPIHQSQIVTHPQQLMQLSEEQRAAFLVEDAKRAKRNHKIYLLSKDNGLMTPQDKNFITRIQLQQLVTATGTVNEQDPDAALAEDFYYQVHSQIRGGPRQNPHQPLSHFAQTYLFQTGGRQGALARRQNRGGDSHMHRMEQQVQRAVEAAKLKPKNKQLVIEGSLGKISFSNAKTPKPLLNIKRSESGDITNRPPSAKRQPSNRKVQQASLSSSDRKTILKNIEDVYGTLMQMEDHERHLPPPPTEESDAGAIQQHLEWRQMMQHLNKKFWDELKVMEPIMSGSSIPHPFIAFLACPKGKKAIPRIFRHLDQEQRVTIMTMIVLHLDLLDVIRLAQLREGEHQLPAAVREEVELFSQAVMPCLFGYVNEAPLRIIVGLLSLILERVNARAAARTKIGLGILTMLVSRAELIKQAGGVSEMEWEQWTGVYNRLFDALEPVLGHIFPGSINSGEDMYVWQFLAAIGIGASPEQQQRLVIAVKDRVMETVMQSKTLPPDMASEKLGNVNLFMRAIGLDVELLG
ncbi:MAG: Protein PAT1 1 [Pleopsidium flavum]|nr:MAG: Protein PAT1 1 [Pleopsidium flavum]